MLNTKLQDALDNLPTVDFTNLDTITRIGPDVGSTDMGYNGLSTNDLSRLTTASVSALATANLVSLTPLQLSAIGSVSPGYTLTSGGTGSNIAWSAPNYNNSAVGAIVGGKGGQLTLKGEDADVVVNGKSMMKLLERIEDRLNLLEPNTELEKEWDDLRKLGERYRRLEKKCKDKAETWKKLKAMPPPPVN